MTFYEKDIRGEITRAICYYAKANSKYIHDCDKSKYIHFKSWF